MRLVDLVGLRFGELLVVERGGDRGPGVTYWACRCDCGATVDVDAASLKRGKRITCGHVDPTLAAGRHPWPHDPRILVGEDGSIVGPRGRLLSAWAGERGYLRVSIYGTGAGRRARQPFVHTIVCETFHGPRPDGHEVAHLNGNPSDARAANLAWKTHADNENDKVEHGTRPLGEQVYCAKLTEDDVRAIRAAAATGVALSALVDLYPVTLSTISRIVLRRTWRHLP